MMGVFRGLWLYAYSGLAALLLCVAPFAAHADVLAQWNPAGTVQSSFLFRRPWSRLVSARLATSAWSRPCRSRTFRQRLRGK